MNRLVLSSVACALSLGLAACDSGNMNNTSPDAGAVNPDAGNPPAQVDAGTPPGTDAGTPSPDAGTGFTAGIQYNGSIAFEKVTP